MKKSAVILALIFIFIYGYSQKIHSNFEIIKLMTDSKLKYEIKSLDKPVLNTDYSAKLNHSDCYRVVSDSGIQTFQFKVKDQAYQKLQKAEMYFQANDIDNALLWYKSTLEVDSALYTVMTYIGQMYEKKKDPVEAINWYKKATRNNYIDFMAHWFMADNYKSINELKNAVDEIVIARILNRNNPRIKKSFDNIFLKARRDTTDWYFNPQIEITNPSENTISISMNDKWVGYAMTKALWMYEPGYSESMGVKKGLYSTLEDRECLITLLIGQINAKTKIKDDPEFLILNQAVKNNCLEEYILYEIVLPKTPAVAYQLPEKTILGIKKYILDVRNKKIN
jgi:tetratricopeptide (TPR) repeat protein